MIGTVPEAAISIPLWLSKERVPNPEVFDPAAGLINPPLFVSCGVGADCVLSLAEAAACFFASSALRASSTLRASSARFSSSIAF